MTHLFVVAHPDDEVLGAGAFIYDASQRGDRCIALVMNTCDTTRYEDDSSGIVKDMSLSQKCIGIEKCYSFAYADSNFHNADHRKMVQDIESIIREVKPDDIFTQHPGDVNSDHFWTYQSCMEAFWLWARGRETDVPPINALYCMEVQSSTDWGLNPSLKRFTPNTFFEVSKEAVRKKLQALQCYENVIRDAPHPRSTLSIFELPQMRGTMCGLNCAEAFECVFRRCSLQ